MPAFRPAALCLVPLALLLVSCGGDVSTGVFNRGKLYLATGGDDIDQTSALTAYDPVTNTWSSKASLPEVRNDAVGVVIGGLFCLVGGQATNTADGALYVYDPQGDSRTPRAPMPTHRYHVNAEAIDGKIYVVSGLLQGDNTSEVVEGYDPVTNTWSSAADITTSRAAEARTAM
ncbi:MAG: hypothetical protein ABI836_06515 [Gemmatimonadota bacterium]